MNYNEHRPSGSMGYGRLFAVNCTISQTGAQPRFFLDPPKRIGYQTELKFEAASI